MWATRPRPSQRHRLAAFSASVALAVAHLLPCGRGSFRVPHDDKPADIDPRAQDIVRRKARSLLRRGGFSRSDLSDLEQDLTLHLLKRLPTFDPRKSDWDAFVTTVVTTWGANLLRVRYADKRDYRRVLPLSAATGPAEEQDNMASESLNEQAHAARLGQQRLSEFEQLELKLDVQEVLQRLPEDLRAIAERLRHISIAELARELGMPRSTLCQQSERIRRRFQRMGLGKNHGGFPSSRRATG